MKCLSLHQPWLATITDIPEDEDPKLCENRFWRPGLPALHVARRLIGQRFALHAASTYARGDFDETVEAILDIVKPEAGEKRLAFLRAFAKLHVPLKGRHHGEGTWVPVESLPFGAIVATARLDDVVWTTPKRHRLAYRTAEARSACMLCKATGDAIFDAECARPDRWAMKGHVGLLLRDVRKLERPIPHKGAQGFFNLPDDVAARLP